MSQIHHDHLHDRDHLHGATGDLGALARLTALASGLAVVLLALLGVGRRLPLPPLGSPTTAPAAWSTWLHHLGAAGALMSGVRLVGVGLAGYLLALVTVELIGRAAGLPRLLSIGHRLSTPLTRHLVNRVAGLGLAASLTVVTVGPTLAAAADTITMQVPTPTPTSTSTPTSTTAPATTIEGDAVVPVMRAIDPERADVPVMRALDGDAGTVSTTATTTTVPTSTTASRTGAPDTTAPAPTASAPDDAGLDAPAPGPGPGPGPGPTTAVDPADHWVIQRGDHLWGVARRTLAGTWQRPPTDAEVARYLDRLIEANLAVLVVPGDADLVIAGQVFTLPPVASP